jgi:hypothetical protein
VAGACRQSFSHHDACFGPIVRVCLAVDACSDFSVSGDSSLGKMETVGIEEDVVTRGRDGI